MDSYTGDRGPFNGSPGIASSPAGNQAFTVTDNNAVLANLTLTNYKTVLRQKSDQPDKSNITVSGITAHNIVRGWETVQGQETYGATLRDSTFTQVERAVARWWSVYDGLIENVTGSGLGAAGEPFGQGIALDGQCHRIKIRNCEMNDFAGIMADGKPYGQGEGFSDEGGNYEVIYDTCTARRNVDAGWDSKSGATFLGVCTAGGSHRNFRLWINDTEARGGTLVSESPTNQDFWYDGGDSPTRPVTTSNLGKIIAKGAVVLTTIGEGEGEIDTRADTGQAIFRSETGPTVVNLHQPYEISDRTGFKWKWGDMTVNCLAGGYYTPTGGLRAFYPSAPPTGAGGVLL